MRYFRRAAALIIPVLAAAGLAAAAAAPASATTWNDTGLQIKILHPTCSAPADVPTIGTSSSGPTLTVPHKTDTLTVQQAGGTVPVSSLNLGIQTVTFTGTSANVTTPKVVVDESDGSGCVTAFLYTLPQASSPANPLSSVAKDTVAISGPDYPSGGVQVTGTSTVTTLTIDTPAVNSGTFAYDVPAGIHVSGRELVVAGSGAQPNTYTSQGVTYTDVYGAKAEDAFQLVVAGNEVPVVVPPGDLGDYVNAYGNGLDVFRQHYAAGSVVAGWTATQSDPATLWVRHDTGLTIGGNTVYSIEATRSGGHATGLCLSNPMGGWSDPAGPTGLLIVHCAGNPQANRYQQFWLDGSSHHLISVVNGQAVSPHGTGAQLTASGPAPWPGGSDYRWIDKAHLPG